MLTIIILAGYATNLTIIISDKRKTFESERAEMLYQHKQGRSLVDIFFKEKSKNRFIAVPLAI